MSTEIWHDLPDSMVGIYCATVADPMSTTYNTAELIELPGPVDYQRLARAFAHVYAENPAVGARFRHDADRGALPSGAKSPRAQWTRGNYCTNTPAEQVLEEVILPPGPGGYQSVIGWCQRRLSQPLHVLDGQGVDAVLLQMGQTSWIYHATHHLIADGFAVYKLLSRVAQIYRELQAGAQPVLRQVAGLEDLANQSRAQEQQAKIDTKAWLQRLASSELSSSGGTTVAKVAGQRRPHRARVLMSPDLQASLLSTCRNLNTGWAQLVIAATGSYLARTYRLEAARVAVPLMNRSLPGSKASTLTSCSAVNLLPLEIAAQGQVVEQVQAVAEQMGFAQKHCLARYEELEKLTGRRGNLTLGQINLVPFASTLNFGPELEGKIHNLSAGPVENITICLRGLPGQGHPLTLEVEANPALCSQAQVQSHCERLINWLKNFSILCSTGGELGQLCLATPAEELELEKFNATDHRLEYSPLAQGFLDWCQTRPKACALQEAGPYAQLSESASDFGYRSFSYQELKQEALRYASVLKALGVGRQDTVGLRTERCVEQFVLVYALLFLGAVYVPLDPKMPSGRLQSICDDASITLICQGPGLSLPDPDLTVTTLSWNFIYDQAQMLDSSQIMASEQVVRLREDEYVYLLFTSGSTGKPKGVMTSALALANRLAWQQDLIRLAAGEKVFHKTPISFDVHIWELYWALTQGACVVLAAPDGHKDPEYLADSIEKLGINVVHFVPSMLAAYLDSPAATERIKERGSHLRALICSGEQLPLASLRTVQERYGLTVYNFYGPTEAAIDVTAFCAYPTQSYEAVPIGRPVWNTRLTVRDLAGQICPPGVIGEIHLHGVQVAAGYLNRPELTRASFYRDKSGIKSYRTGDLGSWDWQGFVHYQGRADSQVKIRGQRVDLGEIEALLSQHVKVSKVAVIYYPSRSGYLGAFLELKNGFAPLEPEVFDAYLRKALPDYMIPSEWVLDQPLPLTPNGKIDRKQLATYSFSRPAPEEATPEVSSVLEEEICRTFSQILGQPCHVETNFFDQGGNSLAALQLLATLERQTGHRGSLSQIFQNPTPHLLARALEGEKPNDFQPVLALRPGSTGQSAYIFLPPAGGLGWCYQSYLTQLPVECPVWALQAPAYSQPNYPQPKSIEEMAKDYRASLELAGVQLAGATLLGWSLGGMVAQELACLLEEEGIFPARVVLLDAYPQASWKKIKSPSEQDKWRAIARMGGLEPQQEYLDRQRVMSLLKEKGAALGFLGEQELEVCIDQVQAAMNLVRKGQPRELQAPALLLYAGQSCRQGLDPASWADYCKDYSYRQVVNEHVDIIKRDFVADIVDQFLPFGYPKIDQDTA